MRLSQIVEEVISSRPDPVEGSNGHQGEEQRHQDVKETNQTKIVGLQKENDTNSFVARLFNNQSAYVCGKECWHRDVIFRSIKLKYCKKGGTYDQLF